MVQSDSVYDLIVLRSCNYGSQALISMLRCLLTTLILKSFNSLLLPYLFGYKTGVSPLQNDYK